MRWQKQSKYSRRHRGQHSPSKNEGLAQATGGHVIWWHTILDSCHEGTSALSSTFMLNLHVCRGTTWQVHLVQLSTIQSSLSSNSRPSCQHMFFSLEFFILPRASFISVFSSVWKENVHTCSENVISERRMNQNQESPMYILIKTCQGE